MAVLTTKKYKFYKQKVIAKMHSASLSPDRNSVRPKPHWKVEAKLLDFSL